MNPTYAHLYISKFSFGPMGTQKQRKLTVAQLKLEFDELKTKILERHEGSKTSGRATVVIAFTTVMYFATTVGILYQMRQDNKLQNEYYKKTVRPFVYADVTKLENFKTSGSDTTVSIKNLLKNAGALPAKTVQIKTFLDIAVNEKFKNIRYDELSFKAQIGSIFPNQVAQALSRAEGLPYSLGSIRQKPYLHTYITYEDIGGNRYFYKSIGQIRVYLADGNIKWDILSRWVHFD